MPQQKKQEAYEQDRVSGAEYPHADRRSRPLKKALARRRQRRVVQRGAESDAELAGLRKHIHFPWTPAGTPLGEAVANKLQNRLERESHNLFRRGYGPCTHAQFRRVLLGWMRGGSAHSAALARLFEGWPDSARVDRRMFLAQFFRNEPAMKRQFDHWIARMKRTTAQTR